LTALELVEQPARAAVYADAGESGLNANRPGLQRLLADIRQGGLRCVIVCDVARLARNTTVMETILNELRAAGVELVTVDAEKRHA
jgi:DNA invertase Pin-like site-specific DNA recombinase